MRSLDQLPKRLGKEPLIDVIFEMRFEGERATQVLPGFLFGRLDGEKAIESLPLGAIPAEMRRANPSLATQPTVLLKWTRYKLFMGDGAFGIACKLPYPGWDTFKPDILHVVSQMLEAGIATSVSRIALKYVDLLDGDDISQLSSNLNAELTIGGTTVRDRPFQLTSVVAIDGIDSQVIVGAPANVLIQDTGAQRKGLVISVDTYVEKQLEIREFSDDLERTLDQIHSVCKRVFFSCLTDDAIQAMEPES